jgi:RHS repeat-associated protein
MGLSPSDPAPPAVDMLLADEQVDWSNNYANGEVLWMLTDHLGSVRDVVDDSATVRKHTRFDAFGNVTDEAFFDSSGDPISAAHAEAVDQLFAWTAKYRDPITGLQWNLHRWYNPETGRWMSEDFIWDGTNRYAYVGNVPTTFVDPSGLVGEVWSGPPGNSWRWKPRFPPVFYRNSVPDFNADPGGSWDSGQVGRVWIQPDQSPIECRDKADYVRELSRRRKADHAAANRKMRERYGDAWQGKPKGYVWHHADEFGQM